MSFNNLGLSQPLLDAIADKGYSEPSPVQAESIPAVLTGRDVMAAAQTGTGKTAGFALPILQILSEGPKVKGRNVRCLVLTPTRELAAQVHQSFVTYGNTLPLSFATVFGGVKIKPQINRLRPGVDVLVATPGRLLDLISERAVNFSQLEVLVLDEADRMLDMGFIRDIKKILQSLPPKRQTLLFSATFSGDIRKLTQQFLKNPLQIEVSPRNATAKTVSQRVYNLDKGQKPAALSHLIRENNWRQVLVFTRTKHGANRLAQKLERDGITSAAIHGNKSQGARTRALSNFKSGEVKVLVATDIAARGLDISELPYVVNFELPNVPEDYVHRIGRTGRAGSEGEAISLVSLDEAKFLADIEKLIGKRLPTSQLDGFIPVETVAQPSPTQNRRGGGGGRRGGGGGSRGGGRSGGNSGQSNSRGRSNSRNRSRPR